MTPSALKIAAAALNTTPLDWSGNLDLASRALNEARAAGANIACLPLLSLSSVGCADAFFAPFVIDAARDSLKALLPMTRGLVVAVGLPLSVEGRLFNAAAIIDDGRLLGFAAKRHLDRDLLSDEARWFEPWDERCPSFVDFAGERVPLGNATFDAHGVRLSICLGNDIARLSPPADADLVLHLGARPFCFGEQARFEARLCDLTRGTSPAIASSNLLGNESGTILYGGGALVAHSGAILARSPRFSFKSVALAVATIGASASAAAPAPADPLASKQDEFARAVSLGLFDYLRKSRSRAFALSLSGGADSAAIAVLVMTMARFALRELGSAGVVQALRFEERFPPSAVHPPWGDDASLERALQAWMPRLLITAYQGTQNSSLVTRDAARAMAQAVGARHLELDVDPFVEGYRAAVESALGRAFDWQKDDLTLQNIQARARAPGIWMIANAERALVLVTSNRSESAVGYATMDGDTSGGLAPIIGIDKAWLREWLAHVEQKGLRDVPPIPALALINAQAPTAELRPAAALQTDEGDLMPYALLDEIERLAIHRRHSPIETWEAMRARHPDLPPETLADFVTRFFRMFARSQWKRSRAAPGFHLDDANLSPESWCRFPLLSGGFERELTALRTRLKRGI